MNDFITRYGEWAFVAGAAEGIGAAFTNALAEKGMNLILADINDTALQETASKTEHLFGIRTRCLQVDLSKPANTKVCLDALEGVDCRFMVYVPAYSPVKQFHDNTEEELDKYLNLNVAVPLHLVHAFTGRIKQKDSGGVILMSSLAGLIGPQFSSPYAATKAFSILLAESLNRELKTCFIDVMACCAGPVSTSTFWSSRPVIHGFLPTVLHPSDVATYALKMLGRKSVCIPGRSNRITYFFLTRLLPRAWASALVSSAMERIYPHVKGTG